MIGGTTIADLDFSTGCMSGRGAVAAQGWDHVAGGGGRPEVDVKCESPLQHVTLPPLATQPVVPPLPSRAQQLAFAPSPHSAAESVMCLSVASSRHP